MLRIIVSLLAYLVALMLLRQLFPGGILFYQGLALAFVSAVAHWVWLRWRACDLGPGERVKDALLVFALAYGFMFTVPTTADRSYSVQMILLLSQHPEGLTDATLQAHFEEQFSRQGGVARRIQEQVATGTIVVDPDRTVRLTERGERIAGASRLTCTLFACHGARR